MGSLYSDLSDFMAHRLLPISMQAYVQERYGEAGSGIVMQKPVPAVGAGEVLLKIHAAGLCKADIHLMTGKPYAIRATGFGLLRPKHMIPGQNVSGVVVATGEGASEFKPGDAVCGQVASGGFAEYVVAASKCFVPKPDQLTHEEASSLGISGLTALQALRDLGQVKPGDSVLITGAGGGVGTFAVQIAQAFGARVTAVCSHRHLALMQKLNVAAVIDYTRENFWTATREHDVFLDLVGNATLADCRSVLRRDGTYIAASGQGGVVLGPIPRLIAVSSKNIFVSQRMRALLSLYKRADLQALCAMCAEELIKPVIGAVCGLDEIGDHLRLVAQGQAQGTHVVKI